MAGSCWHGNQPLGYKKVENFLTVNCSRSFIFFSMELVILIYLTHLLYDVPITGVPQIRFLYFIRVEFRPVFRPAVGCGALLSIGLSSPQ
jgi:hypothetical protein